jgi:hypothetical protein
MNTRRRGFPLRWLAALLPSVLLALAPAGPVVHGQQSSDPDLLRELAGRLLASGGGGFFAVDPRQQGPQSQLPEVALYPGALPPDLDFELPTPNGTRLVGSAASPPDRLGAAAQIVLDVPVSAGNFDDFYENALRGLGWQAITLFGPGSRSGSGFIDAANAAYFAALAQSPPPQLRFLCSQEHAAVAQVWVVAQTATVRDVRVEVRTGETPACRLLHISDFDLAPMPWLLLPQGLRPFSSGTATSTQIAAGMRVPRASDVTVRTSISPAELEAHFARQLEAAGWARVYGGMSAMLAWSSWRPSEGRWLGFLSVLADPAQPIRGLHFSVAPSQ